MHQYNPDWAIVKEDQDGGNKFYLVRETKGTTQFLKLPKIQRKKIQCGKAHFKAVGLKALVITHNFSNLF